MNTQNMLRSLGYGLAQSNRFNEYTTHQIKSMVIDVVEEMYTSPRSQSVRQGAYNNIMIFYTKRKDENDYINNELAK